MDINLSRRELLQGAARMALATPVLSVVACDLAAGGPGTMTFAGSTMGTSYSVAINEPPRSLDRLALKAEIDRALEIVNDQMSNWRGDSELSRFNAAGAGSWRSVSSDTLTVMDAALRIGRLTGGAFDPTVGPLIDLWGFGPAPGESTNPPAGRIEAALGRIGARHIRIQDGSSAIAKSLPDLEVNLSGIAKGFGVDKLAEILDAKDVRHYLVEIGGELRARGHSARGRPWRIGVERPIAWQRALQRIVSLDLGAVATSGNYRNFFERQGLHYSHIIDPRTGAPVSHDLASVTVIAPSAMQADALSTALMVLGPDAGFDLAAQEDLAALFIVKDGRGLAEIATSSFDRYALS
jgi:thiamine biosynthesis lipoprotein